MNPAELLAALVARGIEFQAYGDTIRFCPAERLSADELEALRQNKPALLKLLQSAAASPTAPSPGFDSRAEPEPVSSHPTGSVHRQKNRIAVAGIAWTYAIGGTSLNYTDVSVHDGRSLRRDCSKCNRFMGWPRWYDEMFSSPN